MYRCVCMYVCMCVCVRVYVHVHVYVCVSCSKSLLLTKDPYQPREQNYHILTPQDQSTRHAIPGFSRQVKS